MLQVNGRITADARVTTLDSGKQVVNFSIAINDRYKRKDGERIETTTYVDCAYWINAGVAEYLKKGLFVELIGRIGVKAYLHNSGEARASISLQVSHITMHGMAKKEEPATKENTGSKASRKNKSAKSTAPVADANEITEPIDDLPF